MHPCPKKIQGITEMTLPMDKQQSASFIGMVTYMGNFVPHLSYHTEPLRAMLKQYVVFHWDQIANDSFQKIKDLIDKTVFQLLRYYDRMKPVVVQADASQRGVVTGHWSLMTRKATPVDVVAVCQSLIVHQEL